MKIIKHNEVETKKYNNDSVNDKKNIYEKLSELEKNLHSNDINNKSKLFFGVLVHSILRLYTYLVSK